MFAVTHKYRTTFEELSQYYEGSARAAFEEGNYAYAAHISEEDLAIKAISLIMLGNPEKGLELMRKLPLTPELMYYRAIGNWFLEKRSELLTDLASLEGVPLSVAHCSCLNLVRGEKVNVLLLNREFNVKTFTGNSQINLLTMGYSPSDDIRIKLSDNKSSIMARLEECSFHPDLIIVYRPEYMLLPVWFEEFTCPKIAFVTDYDLHVYQKYADFMRFDAFVVYSGIDHYELTKLTGKPVFTHVLSHSISADTSNNNVPANERQFDIHVTGSSFRRFFADKSALLYQLTQLDSELEIRIDDGFVSPSRYKQTLNNTRLVPTFVRFYGCFPTRGVEALVQGASILYQEGGVLESFIPPTYEGIYPFPEYCVVGKLQQIVENALEEKTKCDSGTAELDAFNASRSVPMFLKTCIIISGLIGQKTTTAQPVMHRQDLCVVGIDDLHGGIAKGLTGEEHCRNFERMIEHNLQLPKTPQTLNSSAILSVYWLLHLERGLTWYRTGTKERLLEQAIGLWRKACELFPAHLVIRFNLARTCFHYGDCDNAAILFQEILDIYHEAEIEPLQDDIMSALFFYEDFFPYREYIDTIIRVPGDESMKLELKIIIASASAWYLALDKESRNDFPAAIQYGRRALEIYPENYLAIKGLTTLLISTLPLNPPENLCRSLVNDFEKGVSAYVLNLHSGFPEYIDLLINMGSVSSAKSALNAWFCFYSRVRRNGELLQIDLTFINKLMKHKELLPERAEKVFQLVTGFTQTGELNGIVDELAEEVVVVLARQAEMLNLLLYGITNGLVSLNRKESIRIIANRLLLSGRRMKGFSFYFRYILRVFTSKKATFGDKLNELLECVAEILQIHPRMFLAARFARQRLLRIF